MLHTPYNRHSSLPHLRTILYYTIQHYTARTLSSRSFWRPHTCCPNLCIYTGPHRDCRTSTSSPPDAPLPRPLQQSPPFHAWPAGQARTALGPRLRCSSTFRRSTDLETFLLDLHAPDIQRHPRQMQ